MLAFTPRAAAREIEKVLKSAVANAEANHGLAGDDLVVAAAFADKGPVLKRFRPRARGRVGRIHKPTCHITITLAQPGERPVPKVPETAAVEEATPEEKPKAAPKRRRTTKKAEEAKA